MQEALREATVDFAQSIRLEYYEVSDWKKAEILALFINGQTCREIGLELEEHLLVVARIVDEGMQPAIIETLVASPFREHFGGILDRLSVAYSENMAEKGESWRDSDLEDLRGKVKEELIEWMDAQETPEELGEGVDLCLTLLMLGERLIK